MVEYHPEVNGGFDTVGEPSSQKVNSYTSWESQAIGQNLDHFSATMTWESSAKMDHSDMPIALESMGFYYF